MTWWLPLILVTVNPPRSSALTTFAPGMAGTGRASGDVEGQCQLRRRPDLGDQDGERVSQARDGRFRRRPAAACADPRAAAGRPRTPPPPPWPTPPRPQTTR